MTSTPLPPWVILLFVWVLVSIPFFAKHFGGMYILPLAYAIAMAAIVMCCRNPSPRFERLLSNPIAIGCLLAAFTICSVLLYPSTRGVPHPSTAPEALTAIIARLFAGRYPYDLPLSDGALISPGVPWVIPLAPFALTGTLAAATGVALSVLYAVLYRAGALAAGLTVVLLLLCIPLLQSAAVGHDLYVIGIVIAIAATFPRRRATVLQWILIALASSARMPLVVVPALFAAFSETVHPRRTLALLLLAISITLAQHIALATVGMSHGYFYHPFHLIDRALHSTSVSFAIGATAVWVGYVLALWRRPPVNVRFALWLALAPPFAAIGVAELLQTDISTGAAWAAWEGKNYVAFLVPLLVIAATESPQTESARSAA
jgi:hypothetical protein